MKNNLFHLQDSQKLFKEIFFAGTKDAVKTSLKIFKIMIPVSLLMAVLNYVGIINKLSIFLQPAANLLGLGGRSILVLLSGYLVNTYSAIALMISLDLFLREMSILSSMVLLSHTLPIELSIQKKAGGNVWLLLFIRVGASILTGFLLALILPGGNEAFSSGAQMLSSEAISLADVLKRWLLDNITVVKIFIINIVLNVSFKFLIEFHLIDKFCGWLKHIMFVFGLAKETALYWLVANVIGLIYGAGILITANESNALNQEDIRKLNISICSMHSLIQETANFLPLGVGVPVLVVPRFITAVGSVWAYNLIMSVRGSAKAVTVGDK